MEVSVPNVPGRINNGPEDFVLKSLAMGEIFVRENKHPV